MTNDEGQMTKEIRMTDVPKSTQADLRIGVSASLVIRPLTHPPLIQFTNADRVSAGQDKPV